MPARPAAARAGGLAVHVVTRDHTGEGLLLAIIEFYANLKEVE